MTWSLMEMQAPAAVRKQAGEQYAQLFELDDAALARERHKAEAEYADAVKTADEAGLERERYYCSRCRDS